MIELAPSLSSEHRGEAFSAALDTIARLDHSNHAGMKLADLAPHLPAKLLPRAFAVAIAMQDESDRAWALSGLARRMPSDLRLRATQLVLDTRWAQLAAVADGDSEWTDATYSALVRRGIIQQPRTRADVIGVIASLAPAITRSGGDAAWQTIATSLTDSFAWWP